MLGYALRRLLLALPLLLGITFVSFTVIHLAPGEPAEIQTGDLSIQSDAQARQHGEGLDATGNGPVTAAWNPSGTRPRCSTATLCTPRPRFST